MTTKLSHVRTYLKEGFDDKVNIKLGKVNKSQKNPHKAYRHDDILELVKQLRNYPQEALAEKTVSEKKE